MGGIAGDGKNFKLWLAFVCNRILLFHFWFGRLVIVDAGFSDIVYFARRPLATNQSRAKSSALQFLFFYRADAQNGRNDLRNNRTGET